MNYFTKSILLIAFVLGSCSAFAGWEITFRTTTADGMIDYEVMKAQGNVVKYSGTEGGFIFNAKTRELMFLAVDTKKYWKGNVKEFRMEFYQAMKMVNEQMMAKLPEDQREMYAHALDGMTEMYASPPQEAIDAIDVKVNKTNETLEIAGYDAMKYEIIVDGSLKEHVWLSDDLDISNDLDMRALMEMFNEISPNSEDELFYEYTDAYLGLQGKGFTMKTMDNELDITEVIKVEEKNIPDSEFEAPVGYTQITAGQLLQQSIMGGGEDDDDDDW